MTTTPLTSSEQTALIEMLGVTAPGNVATGTVQTRDLGDGRILVDWRGIAIISPRQLEVIRAAVAQETAEQGA